jgi:hypothetical protein
VIYQPPPPNFLEEARALIEAQNINNAYEFIEYAMDDRGHGNEYFAHFASSIWPLMSNAAGEAAETHLAAIQGHDLTVWVAKFLDRYDEFIVDELGDDIDVVPI